ncbi:uncharacterized protein DOCK8-AS1-like, partial [Erinaceus europaeus]|uniref:Uncharacterized protein DOCK8-AS1-like n=1 Tax=Erinaceus europaeus TaxID=9365 RepID=A0ABM3WU03_ERIEU
LIRTICGESKHITAYRKNNLNKFYGKTMKKTYFSKEGDMLAARHLLAFDINIQYTPIIKVILNVKKAQDSLDFSGLDKNVPTYWSALFSGGKTAAKAPPKLPRSKPVGAVTPFPAGSWEKTGRWRPRALAPLPAGHLSESLSGGAGKEVQTRVLGKGPRRLRAPRGWAAWSGAAGQPGSPPHPQRASRSCAGAGPPPQGALPVDLEREGAALCARQRGHGLGGRARRGAAAAPARPERDALLSCQAPELQTSAFPPGALRCPLGAARARRGGRGGEPDSAWSAWHAGADGRGGCGRPRKCPPDAASGGALRPGP